MSKVSSLYYLQDLTQREIAERLHLSRPKVSRLLKSARDEGIVQIFVAAPDENYVELENAIERTYGLEEVVIAATELPDAADAATLKRAVGKAAARYLRRTTRAGDVLGITWGTTLQAMMRALEPMSVSDVHVVQTLGGVGRPEAEAHAADLSRRLAHLLGARLTALPVPGIVQSREVRDVLLSDHHTRNAFDRFPKITTAYVGIGALATNPILDEEPTPSCPIRDQLYALDAVGDIALRFFDAHGQPVSTALDERLIGITMDQLRQTGRVVGIAGGPKKIDAVRGALQGHLIDVLITDYVTGQALT